MRKGFLVGLALFLFFPVFSLDIPENLLGIWEGKDRFVFFEQIPDDKNPELILCLKEYYGWYIDRTAEDYEKSKNLQRKRNAGTSKDALSIKFSFEEIKSDQDLWVGCLNLEYSKSQKNIIPICQIDGKMYLDFFIQDEQYPKFYKGCAVSKGIMVTQQTIPENISCFVIDENEIFNIRYWKSDMEYSTESASFVYNNETYSVPKHIISGNTLYSCVSGRSKKIRNVQPPQLFNKNDFLWSKDFSVLVKNQDFYLYRLLNYKEYNDLIKIIEKQNSQRKPEASSVFPPSDVNWHWDLILELEKGNDNIQEFRKRNPHL